MKDSTKRQICWMNAAIVAGNPMADHYKKCLAKYENRLAKKGLALEVYFKGYSNNWFAYERDCAIVEVK